MKKLVNLLFMLLLSVGAYAQTTTIRGTVGFMDDPQPAIGAVVVVNEQDTTRIGERGRMVATDVDGKFTISADDEKIELTFIYTGYAKMRLTVPTNEAEVDLGKVELVPASHYIEKIEITGQASMSMIKEDTIQFNAAAFKTHPDATAEDLLKKMPGVTTDEDGNVEAQGEAIQKVYVNGKEYFEDDPSLALKSLPVDAVESVQLYDDQSDDAKFSGFDDGERIKAINIVTKAGVMNSTSGRASVGYGTDGRYMVGAQANAYGDVHNFAFIGQANNANKRDFSPHSIMSGGGGGGRGGGWNNNSADLSNYSVPTWGGITESYMFGGNYSGDFEKVDVNATYFYTGSNASKWSKVEQNYLATPRDYFQADSSLGYNNTHRFRSKIEWTPAEFDRININMSLDYSNNFGNSYMASDTYLNGLSTPSNASKSDYYSMLERMSGNASLWWQHRFKKPGRTISVGGVFNGSKDSGDRSQYSLYTSEAPDLSAMIVDTIDMIGRVAAQGYSVKGSLTYSEPLGERSRLKANYAITYNANNSDNLGLSYDKALADYAIEDTSTTNYINRDYTTQIGGVGYNYNIAKKLTLNATVNYQYASLNNHQVTPIYDNIPMNDAYAFDAVLPSLSLRFTPKQGENFKLDYNANSIFPSVGQLQTLVNTTNPLQVSSGNANLKQSYTHKLRLGYNISVPEKNINFNLFAMGTLTSDYIANHRQFLTEDKVVNGVTIVKGAQYSSPVNLQGYASAMVYSTFGVGIKPLKSNLNISGYYRFSNTPSLEDNVEYVSQANRFGGSLSLTSNISENVDFTLAYRPGVNLTESGTGRFDRYYSHDMSAFLNVIFLKYFFINADASWKNSFGTQTTYDQHYAMVNAAIGAKFLEKRNLEVKFGVYDALDQNKSVWQWSGDTYTQITNTQVLSRYYMVTLSFKFDTRKNAPRSGGYGGGHGGPPHRHMM